MKGLMLFGLAAALGIVLLINFAPTSRTSPSQMEGAQIGTPPTAERPPVVCGEGSHLVGNHPPAGTRQWCVKDGDAGVRHGPLVFWHENGAKLMEANFENGKMTGSVKQWKANGQPDGEGPMDDKAEKHGRWIEWSENGMRAEGEYVHGVQQGTWISSTHGGDKAVGTIRDGKKDGIWTHYNAQGLKTGETVVSENEIVKSTAWSEDGKSVKTCHYSSGVETRCETKLDPVLLAANSRVALKKAGPDAERRCREQTAGWLQRCLSECDQPCSYCVPADQCRSTCGIVSDGAVASCLRQVAMQ